MKMTVANAIVQANQIIAEQRELETYPLTLLLQYTGKTGTTSAVTGDLVSLMESVALEAREETHVNYDELIETLKNLKYEFNGDTITVF